MLIFENFLDGDDAATSETGKEMLKSLHETLGFESVDFDQCFLKGLTKSQIFAKIDQETSSERLGENSVLILYFNAHGKHGRYS